VEVRGIVVAQAGRIGTPSLVVIADSTGGIAVRLPTGSADPARGRVLTVRGKLAAPYGQLEIRPVKDGLTVSATEAQPAPADLGLRVLGEADEARLVTVTGRLPKRPAKASGGDLTLFLERSDGSLVKVMADASSRIGAASFQVGASYRLTGVVGQRATRSGALDGYRIWLREPADVVRTAGPATSSSPTPTGSATSTSGPSLQPVSIARAKTMLDRTVAVIGIVTAPVTLLDGSGHLVVVQDTTGAIEVRLPNDADAPGLGTKIRVEGTVGTAYGAPRIKADRVERLGTASIPAALVLHVAPTAAHEWRLVTVRGRIDTIRKLGDRWRAELAIGTVKVVVVGQAGAGIPADVMDKGRTATVTGIVRRPYPTATDRRFTILPRRRSDIHVDGKPASATTGSTAPNTGSTSGPGTAGAPLATAQPVPDAPDADLRDLAARPDGELVRVGGLVGDLKPDGFTLDDGTAIGTIAFQGAALELLALIEPGDAINVIGKVGRHDANPVVIVEDPAGVVLAASEDVADATSAADAASAPAPVDADPTEEPPVRIAGAWTLPGPELAGAAGLATLASVTLVSVAVTLLRRRHLQRALAARVSARLAAFAAPPDADPATPGPTLGLSPAAAGGPRSAEHDPRTRHLA
jgi:hypothetical protein